MYAAANTAANRLVRPGRAESVGPAEINKIMARSADTQRIH